VHHHRGQPELHDQHAAQQSIHGLADRGHGEHPYAAGRQAAEGAWQPREHPQADDDRQVGGDQLGGRREQDEEGAGRLEGGVAEPADDPDLLGDRSDQTRDADLQTGERDEQGHPAHLPAPSPRLPGPSAPRGA